MFTGIIECTSQVVRVVDVIPFKLTRILIRRPPFFDDVHTGDSISVNGVCLTVEPESKSGDTAQPTWSPTQNHAPARGRSPIQSEVMQFAVAEETLRLTNLAHLKAGDRVNLERSAKLGERIHGHNVLGHVDETAEVVELSDLTNGEGRILKVRLDSKWAKYLWPKASWALNGVSLTVNSVAATSESITVSHCLIPETLKLTQLGDVNVGSKLNFETDVFAKAMVRSIENYLSTNPLPIQGNTQ